MGDLATRLAVAILVVTSMAAGTSSTGPKTKPVAPIEAMAAHDLGGALRPHPAGWRLALDENFRGTTVDPHRWGRCHWWARGGCTIASNALAMESVRT